MGINHVLNLLISFFLLKFLYEAIALETVDPTIGFESLPLNKSNFVLQKPYNLLGNQRFSFNSGVYRLWVYSNDKPHSPTSNTNPRTEIRIRGYDYSTGVWQFEGYGYVPNNTSGVCIMQIFGANPSSTTLMLKVYHGSLIYLRAPVVGPNIYDRWFKLNVIHDVDASIVKVFIDEDLVHAAPGHNGTDHFFKFGVYAQNHASSYMESRWKDIKIFKKV